MTGQVRNVESHKQIEKEQKKKNEKTIPIPPLNSIIQWFPCSSISTDRFIVPIFL